MGRWLWGSKIQILLHISIVLKPFSTRKGGNWHFLLKLTNTFITILGVNIYSTAVPTIKMAACIVCLIVTITISNPTWIITYTTYLVWKKRCEMSSLLISLFFVMSAHNFNFLFLKFGSMFRMQTWQKKTSKQLSSIY